MSVRISPAVPLTIGFGSLAVGAGTYAITRPTDIEVPPPPRRYSSEIMRDARALEQVRGWRGPDALMICARDLETERTADARAKWREPYSCVELMA